MPARGRPILVRDLTAIRVALTCVVCSSFTSQETPPPSLPQALIHTQRARARSPQRTLPVVRDREAGVHRGQGRIVDGGDCRRARILAGTRGGLSIGPRA